MSSAKKNNKTAASSSNGGAKFKTKEERLAERRAYQREYNKRNRDKVAQYRRQRNIKSRFRGDIAPRQVIKQVFTHSDIMRSSTEQSLTIFKKILSGERWLVM